jgi:hypothetical protein
MPFGQSQRQKKKNSELLAKIKQQQLRIEQRAQALNHRFNQIIRSIFISNIKQLSKFSTRGDLRCFGLNTLNSIELSKNTIK